MPYAKYTRYFIFLAALTFATSACRNKSSQSETQEPAFVNDPAFKNLNDSILHFPSDATLFLRRAIRLTQENGHELANADYQKAWTLQPSLENAMPYAANLEILGKHRDRLNLLE